MKKLLLPSIILAIQFSVRSQELLPYEERDQLIAYVKNTPEQFNEDPTLLINYLKQEVSDERRLIESIYYWMSDNIEYDVEGYTTGNYLSTSSMDLMKSKKSVCEGYANLFKLLCNEADVECEVISGYAKGYGYGIEEELTPNHAWNAVKLNGEWKLVDPTWGSGHVDVKNDTLVYKKSLNLGYIFTKPEGFIIEHFPEDEKWQLLENPISRAEFYSDSLDAKIPRIYMFLR